MTNENAGGGERYALLIGIDYYQPNQLPEGYYSSLRGCVWDITRVEKELLQQKLGIPEDHIFKLTSTNRGSNLPEEPEETWPTYENIVAAFKMLTEKAKPGDQVYIQYSGHGGRSKTAFKDLKGDDGIDESLVPMNIGYSDARYLRDLELASLLESMVDKGLLVTIVLDSCHSGGATRGLTDATARCMKVTGISNIDSTLRPTESLVASKDELAATWKRLTSGGTAPTRAVARDTQPGYNWLPVPQGYTLLAACRPSESAYEATFDGVNNGALTYWLLNTIGEMRPGITYRQIYNRVSAAVHSQFSQQMPMLEGEGDRVFFGSDRMKSQFYVNVLEFDEGGKRVKLKTGQAMGMDEGAKFSIYPGSARDFSSTEERIAIAQIIDQDDIHSTESWANITETFYNRIPGPGDHAILLSPGSIQLSRKVVCVERKDIPPLINQRDALDRVEEIIRDEQQNKGFVTLASDKRVDYQVTVDKNGQYEVWDKAGVVFENLRPPIAIDESGAAERLVQRLVHMSKYQSVEQLDNYDSSLASKLVIKLCMAQPGFRPGKRPEPQEFPNQSMPTLKVGDRILLYIKNNSSQVLNLVALDLKQDWGIDQICPQDATSFFSLDPEKVMIEPFKVDLPSGYDQGMDTIKIIATLGSADFRVLELPPLDQPIRRLITRGGAGAMNALDKLLAEVSADTTIMRSVKPESYPSEEWAVSEVKLQITR